MNSILRVSDLTVTYPNQPQPAIKDISFSVDKGSIIMLIGPNGSGKTTIMKAILGLISYKGSVRLFNDDIDENRNLIGYVPQRFSFDVNFPLTVEEFLHLTLTAYTDISEGHEKRLDQTLQLVNALDLKNSQLSSLSGGQLQRILLARAMIHNPQVLILDEPETGVDVGGEQTFYDLLERLVEEQGLTALISSHELDVVYSYADQVVCVNQKMLCYGTPSQALNQETFEKLYGRTLHFYDHDHK